MVQPLVILLLLNQYAVTVGAGGSAGVGAVEVEQAEPQSLTALADWAGRWWGRNQGSLRWLAGKAGVSIGGSVNLPGGYGTDGQNGGP